MGGVSSHTVRVSIHVHTCNSFLESVKPQQCIEHVTLSPGRFQHSSGLSSFACVLTLIDLEEGLGELAGEQRFW